MNGKDYKLVTDSVRITMRQLNEDYEEGEAITYEDALSRFVETLETSMREEGMATSTLWKDCGF